MQSLWSCVPNNYFILTTNANFFELRFDLEFIQKNFPNHDFFKINAGKRKYSWADRFRFLFPRDAQSSSINKGKWGKLAYPKRYFGTLLQLGERHCKLLRKLLWKRFKELDAIPASSRSEVWPISKSRRKGDNHKRYILFAKNPRKFRK